MRDQSPRLLSSRPLFVSALRRSPINSTALGIDNHSKFVNYAVRGGMCFSSIIV